MNECHLSSTRRQPAIGPWSYFIGNEKLKLAPPSARLCTSIHPAWNSTIRRQMERPIRRPLALVEKKASKINGIRSAGMPDPRSRTTTTTCSGSARAASTKNASFPAWVPAPSLSTFTSDNAPVRSAGSVAGSGRRPRREPPLHTLAETKSSLAVSGSRSFLRALPRLRGARRVRPGTCYSVERACRIRGAAR
jgi:hypothetical protein